MVIKTSDINDSTIGKIVELRGWVYRHRASKSVVFIVLRDATGIVQCTFKDTSKHFKDAESLLIESSVELAGVVKKDERAPTGYEVEGDALKILHKSEPFPITKDQSTELLLDLRHLWIRSRRQTATRNRSSRHRSA